MFARVYRFETITDRPIAERQVWNPTAARHFCSAKVLAGGFAVVWGKFPSTLEAPAKRNFQRKFALRRNKTKTLLLGTKIVVNKPSSNAFTNQKESTYKKRRYSLFCKILKK